MKSVQFSFVTGIQSAWRRFSCVWLYLFHYLYNRSPFASYPNKGSWTWPKTWSLRSYLNCHWLALCPSLSLPLSLSLSLALPLASVVHQGECKDTTHYLGTRLTMDHGMNGNFAHSKLIKVFSSCMLSLVWR